MRDYMNEDGCLRKFSYWMVKVYNNGFQSNMLIYGAIREVEEYLESELPHTKFEFQGMSDAKAEKAKELGMKAYIAPRIYS